MKRRKIEDLAETRKRPYKSEDLRKLAAEIGRRATKLEEMAGSMEKEKVGSIQVDGHQGLYKRGFASIDGFILNAGRELGRKGIF